MFATLKIPEALSPSPFGNRTISIYLFMYILIDQASNVGIMGILYFSISPSNFETVSSFV